jgi:hypothetical protein
MNTIGLLASELDDPLEGAKGNDYLDEEIKDDSLDRDVGDNRIVAETAINQDIEGAKTDQDERIEQLTNEIKHIIRATAQNLIHLGIKLEEAKAILGHGHFLKWLETEFNWSVSTASKMMQASRRFKNVNFTNLNISPSALYLLAAPSTPDEAVSEAFEQSSTGQLISYTMAKNIAKKHKTAAKLELSSQTAVASAEVSQPETQDNLSLSKITDLAPNIDYSLSPILENLPNTFSENALVQANPEVKPNVFQDCLTREWLRMMREQQILSIIACFIDSNLVDSNQYLKLGKVIVKQKIVQVIHQSLKRPSDFFTDYGNGCFLILLSTTDSQGAMVVARKIQKQFEASSIEIEKQSNFRASLFKPRFFIRSFLPNHPLSLKQLFKELLDHEISLSADEIMMKR